MSTTAFKIIKNEGTDFLFSEIILLVLLFFSFLKKENEYLGLKRNCYIFHSTEYIVFKKLKIV